MTKRILLADDDADDRLIFEEVFSEMPEGQFELKTVGNGEEVIAFLEEVKLPDQLPNLIILDQNMPLMSGKDTLIAIKKNILFIHIPVVIYSTYNDKTFIAECHSLGVSAVVSKPDSFEGYAEMVHGFVALCSRGEKVTYRG